MMEEKQLIKEFVEHYLPENNEEVIKTQAVNYFISFSKEKVEKDKDFIIDFYTKHFKIAYENVNVEDFLVNQEDKNWLKIENMNDTILLERVVGLALVSGILVDDLLNRSIVETDILRDYKTFIIDIIEQFWRFSDEGYIKSYLSAYKNKIIKEYFFLVNLELFPELIINLTEEETKELIKAYWEERTVFLENMFEKSLNKYLKKQPFELFDYIIWMVSKGKTTNEFAEDVVSDDIETKLSMFSYIKGHFTKEEKDQFNKTRNLCIKNLRHLRDAQQEVEIKKLL